MYRFNSDHARIFEISNLNINFYRFYTFYHVSPSKTTQLIFVPIFFIAPCVLHASSVSSIFVCSLQQFHTNSTFYKPVRHIVSSCHPLFCAIQMKTLFSSLHSQVYSIYVLSLETDRKFLNCIRQ